MRPTNAALLLLPLVLTSAVAPADPVATNDNTRSAGTLSGGVLTIALEVRPGIWHPDTDKDPGTEVLAFGEVGKALRVPGPLLRATEGTEIRVTIRNASDSTLIVRGLHARSRDGTAPADTTHVAPNTTRAVQFQAGAPGTYYYWASSDPRPLRRSARQSMLGGALVIDPRGTRPDQRERILVLNVWGDEPAVPGELALFRMVINGKSWPNTERFTYNVGDSVRWRVINISSAVHPMHLHGFYYRVNSRGNGQVDSVYEKTAPPRMVVTERLAAGLTISMSWVPERAGNWLFHCHDNAHVDTNLPLSGRREPRQHAMTHEMGNLVMGVHVRGRAKEEIASGRRRMRLIARVDPSSTTEEPAYGYALHEPGTASNASPALLPGPTLLLRRGQPVAITVVNELLEPTAVHWHGIELESYYDGVAGFAGSPNRLAPRIMPRDSFEVRFTPPRAGTFIYHTHVDEVRQQRAGLSGALLVLERDAAYDASTDIVLMLSTPRKDADRDAILLNGSTKPTPIELRVGTRYRFRLVNIHTYRPAMRVELKDATGRLTWRAIAKDGADLPAALATTRPAFLPLSNGETYDFEFTPSAAGEVTLEVTAAIGTVLAVQSMRVR